MKCLGRIFQSLRPRGGAWIITADHGNAETMIDPVTGGPHTYHTTNPVPFILLMRMAAPAFARGLAAGYRAYAVWSFGSGRAAGNDRPRPPPNTKIRAGAERVERAITASSYRA